LTYSTDKGSLVWVEKADKVEGLIGVVVDIEETDRLTGVFEVY
jgi:hypothetical protein